VNKLTKNEQEDHTMKYTEAERKKHENLISFLCGLAVGGAASILFLLVFLLTVGRGIIL